jgi:hypothetical protein
MKGSASASARSGFAGRMPSSEAEVALQRLERFAFLLDEAFRIPGTRWRVGLDGLVGFIPGAGDAVTAVVALYPVAEALRHGVPTRVVLRMLGNIGLDSAVGAIPILGDLFDLRFKSNRRNVELLKRHLSRR